MHFTQGHTKPFVLPSNSYTRRESNNQSTHVRPRYVTTTWSSCSRASRVLEPAASREEGRGQSEYEGTFHTFKELIPGMRSNVGANPHSCKSICWTIIVLHFGPVLIGHQMTCAHLLPFPHPQKTPDGNLLKFVIFRRKAYC